MDDRFDRTKIETVRRLAVRLGIDRVDGVGVGVGADGLRFHWSQNLTFD